MVERVLSLAVLSTICACGGQTTSETGTTSAGPGGGGGAPSGVGGASAGQSGKGGGGGSAASAGAGSGSGGASTGGQKGGASGAGGEGGAAGTGGMCPDFQAGFAGGPATPELAPEGPSCAGGLTCAGRSCCESIRVKGGLLHAGSNCTTACDSDAECPGYPLDMPEVDIQVADFALDTFPVTVGRFRKFVEVYGTLSLLTGAGADPNVPGSGWHTQFSLSLLPSAEALRASLLCGTTSSPGLATWTDVPGSNENKPINCVSWYDAFAFCIWDGGWLPTDAAWEYAAAGGAEDRRFPWGQPDADPTRVPSTCAYSGMACDAATLPEVGAFPAGSGKWGHLDLTGGFSQWTQDADHYYVKPKFGLGTGGCFTGQTDCFYPPSGQGAVVRGGGPLPDKVLHAFDRQSIPVNATFPWLGLRCAR